MKTTKDAVKKWPMNDFLIALEKVFEEHNSCLQVDPQGYIAAASGCYIRLDKALDITNIGNFIDDSLRPENQIKEQKMEKQYKYVNAGIKTVGELVDSLMNGDKLYIEGHQVFIDSMLSITCNGFNEGKVISSKTAKKLLSEIEIRQPLPWYEQEGVFPCLVKCFGYKFPIIVTEFKSDFGILIAYNSLRFHAADCTPLTPSEAAKYGVE